MYVALKKIAKKILPRKILFKQELFIRQMYYQFYKGEKKFCNICDARLSTFIELNHDKMCPKCGSLSRDRMLWNFLTDSNLLQKNFIILDFSPSKCIYRKFKNRKDIQYFSTDFSDEFIADNRFDITQLPLADNTFDVIICYHILELIEDDNKAMQELFRVLKPRGACIVQTPFKEGNTYENDLVKTEEERLQHFGLKDHVRIYSVNGLKERLQNAGFKVKVESFNNEADNKFGYHANETILAASK